MGRGHTHEEIAVIILPFVHVSAHTVGSEDQRCIVPPFSSLFSFLLILIDFSC